MTLKACVRMEATTGNMKTVPKEIGKTSVISRTINPIWTDANVFEIDLPSRWFENPKIGNMKIEHPLKPYLKSVLFKNNDVV